MMLFLLIFLPQFIFGLVLPSYSSHLPSAKVTPVTCPCKNLSCYGHCVVSTDGVHDFGCYGKLSTYKTDWECAWDSGKYSFNTTYRLLIEQDPHCKMFTGISRTSQMITKIVHKHKNLTAHVLEENGRGNCTAAVFKSSLPHPVRCGPPSEVRFFRRSRQLDMSVSWRTEETKKRGLRMYHARYRTPQSHAWEEPPALSKDCERCTLGNLSSSLAYEVQIRCVPSESCTQCPWSQVFTVQPELTCAPVIKKIEVIPQNKGQRLFIIKWTFADAELAQGYMVTVGKASGESPGDRITTAALGIRLLLSHSAYRLSVAAFHAAAASPAAQRTLAPLVDRDLADGRMNVTFNGNSSFTISWQDDLVKTFSCFSVEWWRGGQAAEHRSFFEDENNYEVISLEEPLQPYQKYTFLLLTRPDKMACNLKSINNSEGTYGSVQTYVTEGRPGSAPGNIVISNVTQSSLLLEWSSLAEEDSRGFLLGYLIYYTETRPGGADTETSVTVDPGSNHCELADLRSGTVYGVQMSAFTRGGEGARSPALYFETKPPDAFPLGGALTGLAVVATGLMFGVHLLCWVLKRVKEVVWPSMPNPRHSIAIQGAEGVFRLELLQPINTQRLKEEEEGDSDSLHIIERAAATSNVGDLYGSGDPILHRNREYGDHRETTNRRSGPAPSPSACRRDLPSTATEGADPSPDQTTERPRPPVVFMSDYTTLERFQQATPLRGPTAGSQSEDREVQPSQSEDREVQPSQSEDRDLTSLRLDYVIQPFNPPWDIEEIS